MTTTARATIDGTTVATATATNRRLAAVVRCRRRRGGGGRRREFLVVVVVAAVVTSLLLLSSSSHRFCCEAKDWLPRRRFGGGGIFDGKDRRSKNNNKRNNKGGGKGTGEAAAAATAAAAVAADSLLHSNDHMSVADQLIGVALSTVVGFGATSLVEAASNRTELVAHYSSKGIHSNSNRNDFVWHFRIALLYGAADSLATGARVTGALLLINLVGKELLGLRKLLPFVKSAVNLADVAPRIGFATWIALTASTAKRTLLQKAVRLSGSQLGRVGLVDRLLDFVITIGASANIMELLQLDAGVGFKSVFAASGVSALIFSLASRGLVEQIFGGLMVQAWDAVEEGEKIRLGDGTEGVVRKIGLVETILVGSDDVEIRIPNTQVAQQRVSNLSHVTTSRVQQILRFRYSDLYKLPKVLDSIKDEIRKNCDSDALILDGSKPFDAVLTKYEPDHVQAEVVVCFDLKPGSHEFIQQRQRVLLSIAYALQANNVAFAIPSIRYHTGTDDDKEMNVGVGGDSNGEDLFAEHPQQQEEKKKKKAAMA